LIAHRGQKKEKRCAAPLASWPHTKLGSDQLSSHPLSSNFSVAAFSETVRTFASSNPPVVLASISIVTFRVTPGVARAGRGPGHTRFFGSKRLQVDRYASDFKKLADRRCLVGPPSDAACIRPRRDRRCCEDYPTEVWLRWAPDRASLRFGGRDLAREDIRSVWWGRPLPPQMPPDLPGPEADWATGEALAALEGFWRTLDAHWVNTPAHNAEADSKPEQLRRARSLGFTVPETIVTNDPGAARAFLVAHPNAACKSLRTAHVPSGSGEGVFYTSLVRSRISQTRQRSDRSRTSSRAWWTRTTTCA
jgi:hypothetical protein